MCWAFPCCSTHGGFGFSEWLQNQHILLVNTAWFSCWIVTLFTCIYDCLWSWGHELFNIVLFSFYYRAKIRKLSFKRKRFLLKLHPEIFVSLISNDLVWNIENFLVQVNERSFEELNFCCFARACSWLMETFLLALTWYDKT